VNHKFFANISGMLLLTILLTGGCSFFGEKKDRAAGEQNFWQARIDSLHRALAPDARDHVFEIRLTKKDGRFTLSGKTDIPGLYDSIVKNAGRHGLPVNKIVYLPLPDFRDSVGVVKLSTANLRTSPSHRAELASQLLRGMPVRILEWKDGFYRVRTPSGYLGWMAKEGLHLMDSKAFATWAEAPKILMTDNAGAIYDTLVPGARQVADAVRNNVVKLIQQTGDYYLVEIPGGKRGYVPESSWVMLDEWEEMNQRFASPRDVVLEAAHHYGGIPYLWGGTSVKALDCSGFTKNLYQSFGYLLPRDASQQYKALEPVPLTEKLDSVQAGDLLFFGRKTEHGNKITHVALYIGGGRIIHATGEVKTESLFPEDSLYNDARRQTLLEAGRIFGSYQLRIYPYYTREGVKIFFAQ